MQETTITLVRSADGSSYRFLPDHADVRPGAVVEFRVTSGGPYVVAFEPGALDAESRRLLAEALGDHSGDLRTPVLATAGSRFRLTIPALRPGTYRFVASTHIAYRMAGEIRVR